MGKTPLSGTPQPREMMGYPTRYEAYVDEEFDTDDAGQVKPVNYRGLHWHFIHDLEVDPQSNKFIGGSFSPRHGGSGTRIFLYPPHQPETPDWPDEIKNLVPSASPVMRDYYIYTGPAAYQNSNPLDVTILFCPDEFSHRRVGLRAVAKRSRNPNRVIIFTPGGHYGGDNSADIIPWPITDHVVRGLLEVIKLKDRRYVVDTLAAYSSGHKALHTTLLHSDKNGKNLDLSRIKTVIYYDCMYRDLTMAALEHLDKPRELVKPDGTKETVNPTVNVVVYAGTPGGHNTSVFSDVKAHFEPSGRFHSVDLRQGGGSVLSQTLNKYILVLTYGRIFRTALADGYFSPDTTPLPADVEPLIGILPERGTILSGHNPLAWGASPRTASTQTLKAWGDANVALIDRCYGHKQAWMNQYLTMPLAKDFMLVGWNVTKIKKMEHGKLVDTPDGDNGYVVHDGIVQEFAWEYLVP